MEYTTIFLYFVVYAFLGWVCESIYVSLGQKKWVNRGFLHSPICPIYGFGALLVLYILDPFKTSPLAIFGLGILVTSCLEYFTSWLMEAIFHIRWWDYTTYKYNLNGRICLKNSLMFGCLGLVAVYGIQPPIQDAITAINDQTKFILSSILAMILLADTIVSALNAINLDKALQEAHKIIQDIEQQKALAKSKLDQNIETVLHRLEKRETYFNKAFPHLQHLNVSLDKSKLEDIVNKLKAYKQKGM